MVAFLADDGDENSFMSVPDWAEDSNHNRLYRLFIKFDSVDCDEHPVLSRVLLKYFPRRI